jgi:hypothetical protein
MGMVRSLTNGMKASLIMMGLQATRGDAVPSQGDVILKPYSQHSHKEYRTEGRGENIRQEDDRILDSRTTDNWAGGRQKIRQEVSKILDRGK